MPEPAPGLSASPRFTGIRTVGDLISARTDLPHHLISIEEIREIRTGSGTVISWTARSGARLPGSGTPPVGGGRLQAYPMNGVLEPAR